MSLVSGPGRGGTPSQALPNELDLVVEKHVKYIQSLDTVRPFFNHIIPYHSCTDSVEMN